LLALSSITQSAAATERALKKTIRFSRLLKKKNWNDQIVG
jgi:hypothetical protein